MPNTLTGAPAAAAIYAQVRAHAAALDAPPCLAAVSVGAQPDDLAYLRSIALSAAGCGVAVRPFPLPADCAPETLTDTLRALSADGAVHGVLLLRPLPAALRAQEILDTLDARKDVDGMTTASLGALVTGAAGFAPCTAEACMELLRAHGIDPAGRRVTVVGRSLVIGRPAALLLTRADATVTLCHRKTSDLAARCREADILLAAAGAPGLITRDFVRPGQIVLDAGATALPDGTLRGDVAPDAAAIAVCTPVPGGIGSVTTALLLRHAVQAAENLRHF
ncbi:MAG TPA: bifunctional 5,10-methylenetetrahydrofolate dehydrogenase/5,10-methenyltetrahydrofolate cyclohydrolase [Clostridiales bacterium]|nr:bifunctional 5,10-methylenetetrahydrofolate dehydrogenase/5,10-methenyltetrahydrofolate cyclohydrolase [Clostridiales bacterium]